MRRCFGRRESQSPSACHPSHQRVGGVCPYLDWLSVLAINLECVGISEGVPWCDGLSGSRRVNLKIVNDYLELAVIAQEGGRLRWKAWTHGSPASSSLAANAASNVCKWPSFRYEIMIAEV